MSENSKKKSVAYKYYTYDEELGKGRCNEVNCGTVITWHSSSLKLHMKRFHQSTYELLRAEEGPEKAATKVVNPKTGISIVYEFYDYKNGKGRCREPGCSSELTWHASVLKKHMRRQHQYVYEIMLDQENTQAGKSGRKNERTSLTKATPKNKLVQSEYAKPRAVHKRSSLSEAPKQLQLLKLIESAIAQVFLYSGIPFEFADSEQWKQMMKLLNPSFAAKMPKASELERKYGGGNCLVCQSSLSSNRKSLRSSIGSKGLQIHEVLESWTGKDFYEEEKDSSAVCSECFSKVEKFHDYQEVCQEIQSEIVTSFSQNQCEQVIIKQEPELDYDFDYSMNTPNIEAWTTPTAEPMCESEDGGNDPRATSDSDVEIFECDLCGSTFNERMFLLGHMNAHAIDSKKIRCKTCPKVFKTEHHLEFHELTDHEKQTSPFKCPICSKTDLWKNIAEFRRHFLKHKQERILCTICGFSLKKVSLTHHMQMHNDIRPFACKFPDCSKSFRNAVTQKIHHRTHTGEKNFSCPHCPDKRFAQSYGLNLHKKRYHSEVKATKVGCTICNATFSARFKLKTHMMKVHQVVAPDA